MGRTRFQVATEVVGRLAACLPKGEWWPEQIPLPPGTEIEKIEPAEPLTVLFRGSAVPGYTDSFYVTISGDGVPDAAEVVIIHYRDDARIVRFREFTILKA